MKRFNLLIVFLFVVLLIFLDRQNGLGFIKGPFQAFLIPIQYGFYNLGKSVDSKFEILFSIGKLYDENRKLQEQNVVLLAENMRLKSLAEENSILKEQIGIKNEKSFNLISASVIGFGPTGQERYLVIDKGEEEGIKRESVVILRDILIGKVINVSPGSARVELLTDPNSKVPVMTEGKAGGLLIGQFQAEMRLTKVLPEEELKEKDIVLTSGEGGYPRGLVIGVIEKVKRNDKDIFQEAIVMPLLNYNKLSMVFIIK